MSAYQDILYQLDEGVAHITINRPDVYNAFRGQTCEELLHALSSASAAREVGVIVLAGAGDKAFCTGGDQSAHGGSYDELFARDGQPRQPWSKFFALLNRLGADEFSRRWRHAG